MNTPNLPRFVSIIAIIALTAFRLARAQVVEQADFNGTGTFTGDRGNNTASLMTLGATGSLTSATKLAASIGSSSPLFSGEPGYLDLNDTGAGSVSAGVTISPVSDANTLDSWFTAGGSGDFDTINGGFDFYFRCSVGSAGWDNTGGDFRPLDISGGAGGLRIVLNAPAASRMQIELMGNNSGGTTVQDLRYGTSSLNTTANAVYHVAVTASTNPSTGTVTLKLFVAPGDTPINPASNTYLVASGTSSGTFASSGTNAITHGFYTNDVSGPWKFVFGQADDGGPQVKTTDFGCFRIYRGVPAVFPAVQYLPDVAGYVLPPGSPALPSNFDPFVPQVTVNGVAGANTPAASEWIRTAKAGESVIVAGNKLSNYTGTDAGKDSQFLVFGENGSTLQLTPAAILRETGNNAAIRMDPSMPNVGAYMVWPRNSHGYGTPFVVNKAEAWWLGPNPVAASGTVSLYGRNLTSNLEGSSTGTAYIFVGTSGGTPTQVTPIAANPYKVDFIAPSTPGTYQVYAHNSHGGRYGWSAPLTLTVTTPISYTGQTFDVTSYGADKTGLTDSTVAINKALTAAANVSSTYPTVHFPTGTYTISNSLGSNGTTVSPANTQWKGDGPSASEIVFSTGTYNWPHIIGVSASTPNVTVTGLQLNAGSSIRTYLTGGGAPNAPVSGFTMTNCNLVATGTYQPATTTISAFATGATTLTVASTANLIIGEGINGTGIPGNDWITAINTSASTITLNTATGTSEPAEAIVANGCPAEYVLALNPVNHLVLRNDTFSGNGIFFSDAQQCIVDTCTFNGMWDNALLNITGYTSQVSYTNNVGQDYDNYRGYTYNPNSSSYTQDSGIFPSGWSQGPFFKGLNGQGARQDTYIGNNTGMNMGVRLGNPTGDNWGEQISFEQNYGQFESGVSSATASSVALTGTPSGTLTSTPLIAAIINGTGAGQWRDVSSINGNTVTLTSGETWNVPPDGTSSVALGWYVENVVSYENSFTGKSDRVGPSQTISGYPGGADGKWGITGFLPYGGVLNAIADSNVYTYAGNGINAVSMVPRSAAPTYICPDYFLLMMNNTMHDCQFDAADGLSTDNGTYTNTLLMDSAFAHVYRNNTASDSTAGDTLYGIQISAQPNGVSNAMDMILSELNTITDTPVGVNLFDGGSSSQNGSFIFTSNDFALGSTSAAAIAQATGAHPVISGSYGINIVSGEPICLLGNTWSNFSHSYVSGEGTGALTPVLEAPTRVFDETASHALGTVATEIPSGWNAGSAAGTWTASSDSSWLTFSPASPTGTLTGENDETGTFTLTCTPTSLGSGTYTGNVTLTMGGQTKKLLINYTVNP